MDTNKDLKPTSTPDPFISQNVWLKRLGLIILVTGLGFSVHPVITVLVVVLAVVTYFIKQIKDFFKSIWNS